MPDLKLRRSAIKELINDGHSRLDVTDEMVNRSKPDMLHNALVGYASWNTQAIMVLLQIELDRLESLEKNVAAL